MPERRVTRREAVQIGAGAAALAALPSPALAAGCEAAVFEMPLPEDGLGALAAGGWRTLDPMRAPRRFDLLGVRWRHAREARIQVRARRRRGEWTRWTDLHLHPGHGPDAGRPPAGTDPAWTGPADYFQVRLRGDLSGARVRFVRAAPAAGRARARAAARQAAAAPGAPAIVTRAQWGGDRCPPRSAPDYGEVQLAFVHHTVTASDYAPEESAAIVLGICRYHRDTNGWNDIGYNLLVDKHGQIFEGRAGGVDQAVVGAQAQGYNSVSTGVACIGDFSEVAQSEAGIDALARLLGWKLSLHGVPVEGQVTVTSAGGPSNRYPSGEPVTLERISGHRDGGRTACPGDALYAQLADLRRRAAAYAGPVSSLSLRAEDRSLPFESPVAVSGALRFSDGASPAGAAIEVQHQPEDDPAWATLTTARAAADGAWSASVTPPASGRVRARFPGDGAHPPLESAAVRIVVLPRLTLEVRRRVEAGSAVDVDGTLRPTWPSRIRLVFERRSGRRWIRLQRKRINVRGGSFSSYVRPPQTGVYRVRVKAPGATARRRFRALPFTGGASAG